MLVQERNSSHKARTSALASMNARAKKCLEQRILEIYASRNDFLIHSCLTHFCVQHARARTHTYDAPRCTCRDGFLRSPQAGMRSFHTAACALSLGATGFEGSSLSARVAVLNHLATCGHVYHHAMCKGGDICQCEDGAMESSLTREPQSYADTAKTDTLVHTAEHVNPCKAIHTAMIRRHNCRTRHSGARS